MRIRLPALFLLVAALTLFSGDPPTAEAQSANGVHPPATLTMFEGDDSIDIVLSGTIPSGRNGDIYIRHAAGNVGGTATRSADATCSSGEDFVFLTGENDTISPAAGATEPVYSWTDIAICKDGTDESAETITLVWTSSSGTPFDSSQSHCSSNSTCSTTVTIYDS